MCHPPQPPDWIFWRLAIFVSISPWPVAMVGVPVPRAQPGDQSQETFKGLPTSPKAAARPAWTIGPLDSKLGARSPVLERLWISEPAWENKRDFSCHIYTARAALFSDLAGFPCVLFHITYLLPPPLRWLVEIKYPEITLKGEEKLIQNFNQNTSLTVPRLWNVNQTSAPWGRPNLFSGVKFL